MCSPNGVGRLPLCQDLINETVDEQDASLSLYRIVILISFGDDSTIKKCDSVNFEKFSNYSFTPYNTTIHRPMLKKQKTKNVVELSHDLEIMSKYERVKKSREIKVTSPKFMYIRPILSANINYESAILLNYPPLDPSPFQIF